MSFWAKLPTPILGLAPMDGVTDPCFRRIVARWGKPDVIITEFVNVEGLLRGVENEWAGLRFDTCERPIVAQVYGARPVAFFHVAQWVCALGFDGLEINMGCPAKNVAARGCGAALIRDPERAKAILREARRGIAAWAAGQPLSIPFPLSLQPTSPVARRAIPLSVKTRLGYDRVVIGEWMAHLLDERPAAITVHGRTLQQGYRGDADWEAIAQAVIVARGSGTRVLGNGDVQSLADAHLRARQAGVDGALVGRATLGRPWWFRGAPPPHPVPLYAALAHARLFQAMYGLARFAAMRKHLGWYCKGFPGASELRVQMMRVKSAEEVEAAVRRFTLDDRAQTQNGVEGAPHFTPPIAIPVGTV